MMSQDLHELAGIYALDALPADEQARFEEHLAACAACRREVAELQDTMAGLAELTEEPPPSGLKNRVLAAIDEVPQEAAPPAAPSGQPRPADAVGPTSDVADGSTEPPRDELAARRATPPWWTGVLAPAAAVVAVLIVGVGVLVANLYDRIGELETASAQVADVLAAPDAETVTVEGEAGEVARVVLSQGRGEAVFVADGMSPVSPEQTFQLWLIDEEGPESAGLFDVDEQGRVTQVLAGDLQEAAAIGVTVEPAGGSPQPTTDPVLVFDLADA